MTTTARPEGAVIYSLPSRHPAAPPPPPTRKGTLVSLTAPAARPDDASTSTERSGGMLDSVSRGEVSALAEWPEDVSAERPGGVPASAGPDDVSALAGWRDDASVERSGGTWTSAGRLGGVLASADRQASVPASASRPIKHRWASLASVTPMTVPAPAAAAPGPSVSSDIALFDDPVLAHPYGAYREIRDAAPAVYLPRYDVWAVARFEHVRHALRHHLLFSSAHGVGLLDAFNAPFKGSVQASDPPDHRALRGVLADQLAPHALGRFEADIVNRAETLVDHLVDRGHFDAVTDLARPFPLATIGDLIGLAPEARADLLSCAETYFQAGGPMNAYTQRSLLDLEAVFTFLTKEMARARLRPDGMAVTVYDAADQGRIDPGSITNLLRAFALPSIHTIASGLGSMLWLLATHPEAWYALRANPGLVASAVEESLRLETPIQMFCRVTTRDVRIGDVVVPEGRRVLLLLGAANRDPARWPDPEIFDVRRNPIDHLGFGYGIHACIGHALAKMHLRAILGALVHRATRLHLDGAPCRRINNTARAFASVPVSVTRW